jgi:hypothetical protein
VFALLPLFWVPDAAFGQAICSGPHAGPGRPTTGSIQTEAPGAGWLQATLFHHDTREFFNPDGRTQPFLTDGRVATSSVYLSAAVGVLRGMDVMAQLPIHRLRFSDASGARARTGFGDPRLYLRVSPELFRQHGLPVAVRAGVKLVGAEFPVDAQVIPITEGQRDWELILESGHSFATLPLHLRGWIGYRWREANQAISREPGDERFAYVAVGGPVGRLGWELAVEGLSGLTPRQQGFAVPTARRELLQVYPSLLTAFGPGQLELGGRVPLEGRNFPSGPAVSVGYSWRWGDG